MADASALPTDHDQQPGPTSASLESPGARSEPPGEPPIELAAPAEAESTSESTAESIEVESSEVESLETPAPEPGAGEAPQAEQAPDAEVADPEPAPSPAEPAPAASFSVPIPSFSSPGPALSLGFESGAKPPVASPEPAPAPLEPAPMAPIAEPAWGVAMASDPEPAPPEAAPAPEPEAVPVTPPPVPTVATTIDLPARGEGTAAWAAGEGGEWALLLSKLQAWLGSGQLQAQLQAARTPLTLGAGLIALVVVLQLYGALLGVIGSFPLAPGLLELVGLIAVIRFGLTKLVRSQERRALIEGLQQRWKAFRGMA